jgi:hypothetical protein
MASRDLEIWSTTTNLQNAAYEGGSTNNHKNAAISTNSLTLSCDTNLQRSWEKFAIYTVCHKDTVIMILVSREQL